MFHMVNMSLSYLIVPPLILLGTPAFVWRRLFGAALWRRFRWAANPIFTLLLFNGLFSFYHVPVVYDYIMTHYAVHAVYYAVLLIAAFLMWWHVTSPVPEWNRLSDLRKMGYIFANGLLLTPACALIIFAGEPLYRVYTDPAIWASAMGYCVSGNGEALLALVDGPSAFTMLGPFEDQQSGGIIMKLVQEVMYGSILAYVFFQWFRKERDAEEDASPALPAGHSGNNA
jgi:putative membrane protein